MAVRTSEVAHVLNDPEYFDIDLSEHLQSLPGILQAYITRGRDDDGACERNSLYEGNHHVTCSGRQIHHEIIQLAPVHLLQKLPDDLMQHRPAHDQWLIAGRDIPDRNGL